MKNPLLLFLFTTLFFNSTFGQDQYSQYFDGADTSYVNSIIIELDTGSSNIWQIGSPEKIIFDSAATQPNVIVTDTANFYPANNISRFTAKFPNFAGFYGILALQWKQKLDIQKISAGGIIEFTTNNGNTWENAFNNPYVYSFYGYLPDNMDTLGNGEYAFSGTDSTWRDIWLCFSLSWMNWSDTVQIRFTFQSDSTQSDKEGWIIDNMLAHITFIHTVSEMKQEKYLNVYPNPARDIINVEAQKLQDFHIIEHMALVNSLGQIVDEWQNIPTKFFIKTHKYSNGLYQLKIQTNIKSETIPVAINRN